MTKRISELWEVLVPVNDRDGNEIPVEHHHAWDELVRGLAGGLTLMRTVQGQWEAADGEVIAERVIPVRVACDEPTARQIMEFTIGHYDQQAVMGYRVSELAIIMRAEL